MVCLRHTCLSTQCCCVELTGVCTQSISHCRSGRFAADSAIASSDPQSWPWGNAGKCLSICVWVKRKTRLSFRQSRVTVRTCTPSEAKEHFGILQLKLHLGLASCPNIITYFFPENKRSVSMLSFYWENGYHKMCSSTFNPIKVFCFTASSNWF